jgi:hypothetical protein
VIRPLQPLSRPGDIGTEEYRKRVAELTEDRQRQIHSLETLLDSGGFRLLCDLAQNEAAAAVASLAEIPPTDAAAVAAVQRILFYNNRLHGAVLDAINLLVAGGEAGVIAEKTRAAKEKLDAVEETWRNF